MRTSSQQLINRMTDLTQAVSAKDWLSADKDKLEVTVSRIPDRADIDPLVNEQLIVELYSRSFRQPPKFSFRKRPGASPGAFVSNEPRD